MAEASVPWTNEDELLFLVGFKCTVDFQRGPQKHHVDGNRNNDNPDNWTILCPNCHDIATKDLQVDNTMTAKLSPDRLRQFRRLAIEACVYGRIGTTRLVPENQAISPELGLPAQRVQNPSLIERTLRWLNGDEI